MSNFLYRVSTKRSSGWSNATPKPIYVIAASKEAAAEWVNDHLDKDLAVVKIIALGEQVSGNAFIASN